MYNISQEIIEFLDADYHNRFKIELLMMPSWATKNKCYKIGEDMYTHIRVNKR